MPDKVVFKDVHPIYDGEYEFDGSSFTNRELHLVKRLSGCRVGELEDALENGDTDVMMAIGAIALARHGKQVDEDTLWDAPAGAISMQVEDADVDPPDRQPPTGSGSQPAPSGGGSESTSESPESGPSPTGSQPSDTSATSA